MVTRQPSPCTLKVLIALSPAGCLSMADLRASLTWLETNKQFLCCCGQPVFKVATESADRWRCMCRHVYNRKRDNAKGAEELRKETPSGGKSASSTSLPPVHYTCSVAIWGFKAGQASDKQVVPCAS